MRVLCTLLFTCFICAFASAPYVANNVAQAKTKTTSSQAPAKKSAKSVGKSKKAPASTKKASGKSTATSTKKTAAKTTKKSGSKVTKADSSKKKSGTVAKNKKTKSGTKAKVKSKKNRNQRVIPVLETPFEDTVAVDTGMANDIPEPTRAGASQVQVSVRGVNVNFERVVEACLYNGNQWLVGNQNAVEVEDELAQLAPTFVAGVARFAAGSTPSQEMIGTWNALRTRLQAVNSVVGFDITLDLQQYSSADAVISHMQSLSKALVAEAWTFTNVSQVAASRPEILKAAVTEAKVQGRFVGGFVQDIAGAEALDYYIVVSGVDGDGLKNKGVSLVEKVKKTQGASGKTVSVLALSGAGGKPGDGFVIGKTPAERRKLVMSAAKAQQKNVAYAYPLFGPIGSNGKAYDATRDEFMVDTVRRSMKRYNRLSNRAVISIDELD